MLIGATHDFFSGFMSLRNDGSTMPAIISKYLGTTARQFVALVTIITGVLGASVFSTGSAALIGNLTSTSTVIWTILIHILHNCYIASGR
ncbi:carbon starvation CstA family protein [uncultured Methanobrevibacter sp.]|uniref:carbon starvation CstA family protein n=1 Tax=uncultured Methanobrevibacter sp. TaxID=253161 RepID=UPI0025FB80F7|nr:carbon starvation CstA family protein [uncultured Methanobrevibacter sp.]